MADRPESLMLLDTASLYFRAFYGVPEIRAKDGTPVNAVRGLLDFIARLVCDRPPTQLVACLDADWRPVWRVALLPSYKAHRAIEVAAHEGSTDVEEAEDTPDELSLQVPIILDVLEALGICALGVPDFEADDVIGTLTVRSAIPVDVVTGDRDLFQLVDDRLARRILYTAARGVGMHDVVDEAWVANKYGIPGQAYADFATLRGDPSDGLPGVKGVGDKTAAALLAEFGSLDAIMAAAQDATSAMGAPVRKKVLAGLDYLAVAPTVVAVAHDVPVPADLDMSMPRMAHDPARVVELAERWNLKSSIERVTKALALAP